MKGMKGRNRPTLIGREGGVEARMGAEDTKGAGGTTRRKDSAGHLPNSNTAMRNTLYYGDNLDIMREHIADESVDLI